MARYAERLDSLFDSSMKRTMTVSTFNSIHAQHTEHASNELDEACMEINKEAERLPSVLEAKLLSLHKALDDDDPYKKVVASMLEQRLQKEALLADIASTKIDQKRLGDFLRMIDFLMIESLFMLARNSYAKFQKLCAEPPASMRQGVFSTALRLQVNPNALETAEPEQRVRVVFNPTCAAMNAGLDDAFDASLSMIDSMQRVMLPIHMQASDGPGSLAALDNKLCFARATMRSKVSQHFVEAAEYATSFDKYKSTFAYADAFDEEQFMEDTRDLTYEELAEKLSLVNGWVVDVSKMRAEKPIGELLLVESRGLKEQLTMLLEEPLAVIKDKIVEAYLAS